jgi:hypothetical protein
MKYNRLTTRFLLSTLLLCLVFLVPVHAQKPGAFTIGAGVGYSKLKYDTVETNPSLLPCLDLNYNQPIISGFGLNLGAHYALTGSNTENDRLRLRNQYIGLHLGLQYEPIDFFQIYANYYYDALLSQRIGRLDGGSKSGLRWEPGRGYGIESGVALGIGLQLNRNLWLQVKKILPVSDGKYSSLQFTLCFKPSNLKVESRGSKYKALEPALADSQNCERLSLMNQHYTVLPVKIGNLPNLHELVLNFNDLHTLPKEIAKLGYLHKLSVTYNYLDSLPAEICELANLEELYLDHNQLRSLPKDIGRLKKLRFLSIGKNNLESLPASLGDLENLVELNLSHSGVMLRIPPELNKLKSLETLIIDRTTQFPIPFNHPNPRLQIIIRD